MAICEAPFERETELETWAFANLGSFLGPCNMIAALLETCDIIP
jgi:hypothetical protein